MLVAALAVPLLSLQAWWSVQQYEEAREGAEINALGIADAAALGVRQFLGQVEELMSASSERLTNSTTDAETCRHGVDAVAEFIPFLDNVMVVGRDGSVFCSHIELSGPMSVTRWPWFDQVWERPGFWVGGPQRVHRRDISGDWHLPLILTLYSASGEFNGALVGQIDLIRLGDYIGVAGMPQNYLVTVASSDRVIIARSRDAETQVGQSLPALSGSDTPLGQGRAVARGPDADGVPRMWGQVELPSGWIIYAGVSDAVVLGPALQASLIHLAITLFIVLLAFVLAGLTYREIASALGDLGRRTREMAEGGQVAVPEGTPPEVAEVVKLFNESLAEREDAQRGERRARERYQSLFDNAAFGLYVSTNDGRFLEVNSALAAMLGYESPEAMTEVGVAECYANPAEREFLVAQSLASGQVPPTEAEWLTADGRQITVRLFGKLIRWLDDDQVFEMVVQDITEERRTEDELRHTQKMEAIGQLAGGIAHDFNNLLTVIGGNVELLREAVPDDDAVHRDLSEISRATRRAASLTQRLLAFSSRQPRGGPLSDGNTLIRGLGNLLEPLIGENVELQTELTGGPYPIDLDPGELEQMVLNLVLNARDALPQGGTIRIETESAVRESEAGDPMPGMRLSVSDDGIGMKPAIRQRIFEPFFTTKAMGRGTGLGLSTVYGIVNRAGGSMDVKSAVGAGTTMSIWLPLSDAPSHVEEVAHHAPTGGQETILVVEDDEQVVKLVERALSECGYTVLVASDGVEALDVLRTQEPQVELVLSDVVMPRVGGLELAERVRQIAPEVPVLFMSGYVDDSFVSQELQRRPDLVLLKPFSPAEVRSRVRKMLDQPAVTDPV